MTRPMVLALVIITALTGTVSARLAPLSEAESVAAAAATPRERPTPEATMAERGYFQAPANLLCAAENPMVRTEDWSRTAACK